MIAINVGSNFFQLADSGSMGKTAPKRERKKKTAYHVHEKVWTRTILIS